MDNGDADEDPAGLGIWGLLATASRVPYTSTQALMEAPPHHDPRTSQSEMFELRERIVDAFDGVLSDKERWVIDAVVYRSLSVRFAAKEIGIGKTELCRIRDMAFLKLRAALRDDEIVRPHLDIHVGPKTWQEAAALAGKTLSSGYSQRNWMDDTQLIEAMRQFVDKLAYPYFIAPMTRDDPFVAINAAAETECFMRIGVLAMDGVRRRNGDSMRVICEKITTKQRDYGHLNIVSYGTAGLCVRLADKLARLENLIRTDREPANEPIADTWMDLVGYSLIGLMWTDGSFMLDLAEDVVA
jgi:hypothetical protein